MLQKLENVARAERNRRVATRVATIVSTTVATLFAISALTGCMSLEERQALDNGARGAEQYYNSKYHTNAKVEDKEYIQGYSLWSYNTDDMIFTMSDGAKVHAVKDGNTFADNRQAKEITQALYTQKWKPAMDKLESYNTFDIASFEQTLDNADDAKKVTGYQVLFNYVGNEHDSISGSFFSELYRGDIDDFLARENVSVGDVRINIDVFDADLSHDGSWHATNKENEEWYHAINEFADDVMSWQGGSTSLGNGASWIQIDISLPLLDSNIPHYENGFEIHPTNRESYIGECWISDEIRWNMRTFREVNDDLEYAATLDNEDTPNGGIRFVEMTGKDRQRAISDIKQLFVDEGNFSEEGCDADWTKIEDALFNDRTKLYRVSLSDEYKALLNKHEEKDADVYIRYKKSVNEDIADHYFDFGRNQWYFGSLLSQDGCHTSEFRTLADGDCILVASCADVDSMCEVVRNQETAAQEYKDKLAEIERARNANKNKS